MLVLTSDAGIRDPASGGKPDHHHSVAQTTGRGRRGTAWPQVLPESDEVLQEARVPLSKSVTAKLEPPGPYTGEHSRSGTAEADSLWSAPISHHAIGAMEQIFSCVNSSYRTFPDLSSRGQTQILTLVLVPLQRDYVGELQW